MWAATVSRSPFYISGKSRAAAAHVATFLITNPTGGCSLKHACQACQLFWLDAAALDSTLATMILLSWPSPNRRWTPFPSRPTGSINSRRRPSRRAAGPPGPASVPGISVCCLCCLQALEMPGGNMAVRGSQYLGRAPGHEEACHLSLRCFSLGGPKFFGPCLFPAGRGVLHFWPPSLESAGAVEVRGRSCLPASPTFLAVTIDPAAVIATHHLVFFLPLSSLASPSAVTLTLTT